MDEEAAKAAEKAEEDGAAGELSLMFEVGGGVFRLL